MHLARIIASDIGAKNIEKVAMIPGMYSPWAENRRLRRNASRGRLQEVSAGILTRIRERMVLIPR